MSKINVGDLREIVKGLNKVKAIEIGETKIEVQQYLPMIDKLTLAKSAGMSAINEDDTLQVVNENSLQIAFRILVIKLYTDIKLPKDNYDAYDLLMSSGVYDAVVSAIPNNEMFELEQVLVNHIQELNDAYNKENKIENIVKNALENLKDMGQELISKLPDEDGLAGLMQGMKKELNELNPDNLKFITDFVKASDKSKVVD